MSILDFVIPVHLGCSEGERSMPQLVSFELELSFKATPNANSTDRLEDALCYASLCETIKTCIGTRHFNLLEYLAQEVFNQLKKQVPSDIGLILEAHKVRPPIDRLEGGVKYRIEADL